MQEGAAEFFGSAKFGTDGSVGLGLPAQHRAAELVMAADVTVTDLLDPDAYEKRRGNSTRYDDFYGKAWLLYHYLTFEPSRRGQLTAYGNALIAGKTQVEAAHAAFGDFAKLEKELDGYLFRSQMSYLKLPAEAVQPGPISVRPLSPGESAVMPLLIRSKAGVNTETAPVVLQGVRALAERFPDDPAVLSELAEAQHDAGHEEAAIKAADAAIRLNPHAVNAFVQKGYAWLTLGERTHDAADFGEARSAFRQLNAFENDNPIALAGFFRSIVRQGITPTANAVRALEKAVLLAPFDMGLRVTVAMQELRDHKPDMARSFLLPVAYNPHGGHLADYARQVLARIEQDRNWDGSGLPPPTDQSADPSAARTGS
jgi:tetratricopeptide (TPR) repeat protein